jgi:SagB-type dehydrogenase family enzyme
MDPEHIGQRFFELTRYEYRGQTAQDRGEPQPPLELPFPAGAETVELPAPLGEEVPRVDLVETMNARRSLRHYGAEPLSLWELSFLLWCTQGVQAVTQRPATMRPVPSAGARHAFETIVWAGNVAGLEPGLYRFLALEQRLLPLRLDPTLAEPLVAACGHQRQVARSAATFFWVAVAERMTWRYGGRGYRYLLLDAGHVCQNLYLAAEAIRCGACAIGAYDDVALNSLLGLDGEELFVVYAATVGKRAG